MSLTDPQTAASDSEASVAPNITDQQLAAYREAAHIVVLAHMTGASPATIAITPKRDDGAGHHHHPDALTAASRAAAENEVCYLLAGAVAEHLVINPWAATWSGVESLTDEISVRDLQRAKRIMQNWEPSQRALSACLDSLCRRTTKVLEQADVQVAIAGVAGELERSGSVDTQALAPHLKKVLRSYERRQSQRLAALLANPAHPASPEGAEQVPFGDPRLPPEFWVKYERYRDSWSTITSSKGVLGFIPNNRRTKPPHIIWLSLTNEPLESVAWRQETRQRLWDGQVRHIHSLRSQGLTQKQIAKRLGVSRGSVAHVLRGRSWREVGHE